MVVVRESPHAVHSPHKNPEQWPPRSPFQALLSSPSGRRKWQDRRAANGMRSVSPSPVKWTPADERLMADAEGGEQGDDDEEDEEMLQLKLQAIEAKLKLKKLQNARKTAEEARIGDTTTQSSLRSSQSVHKSPLPKVNPSEAAERIEIPLSPTKDRILKPKEQTSPARARLGLGATLRADGVSLKRARDGTQLQHSNAQRSGKVQDINPELSKPTSFSERLARSKIASQEERDKRSRLENARSTEFAREGQENPRSFVSASTPTPSASLKRPSSAHQLPISNTAPRSDKVARSASTRAAKALRQTMPRGNGLFSSTDDPESTRTRSRPRKGESDYSTASGDNPTAGYDPFTELHLSKRHIPHVDIAREMANKEIYTLVDLLKEVKAPHYDPPDCERDYVVFAILASKSQPFDQRQSNRTSDENKPQEDAEKPRNKFMVLHLTDLKWEVDLFLFGTAFDQFWKLTPGTLIAILNPAIMPPKGNQHSGRFSIKLGSSEDCVMEVGVARDLGYCASVKKDGQKCGTWIDKRKTEVCDFHLDMMINRERKGRMEVNTMWRSHQDRSSSLSPRGARRGPRSISTAAVGFDKAVGKDQHKSFHPEYGRLYSIPGGSSKSAANLLDAEDSVQQRQDAQEASRKRIAAAQKERDLAKRLGEMGKGVGAEYLRANMDKTGGIAVHSTFTSDSDAAVAKAALFDKPSAAELGLLANKAEQQHLSPAKDRKRHFGLGALSATNGGADAVGWGGARKAGLLQPRESRLGSPEQGQTTLQAVERSGGRDKPGIVRARSTDGSVGGSLSPSKKRARFALEKGIREPGRESLGEVFKRAAEGVGSDDDDLDIV